MQHLETRYLKCKEHHDYNKNVHDIVMLKFNLFNQFNWWVEIIQWIYKIAETKKKGFSSSKLNLLLNIIQSWAVFECLKSIAT